jgi:hypothetical protein
MRRVHRNVLLARLPVPIENLASHQGAFLDMGKRWFGFWVLAFAVTTNQGIAPAWLATKSLTCSGINAPSISQRV